MFFILTKKFPQPFLPHPFFAQSRESSSIIASLKNLCFPTHISSYIVGVRSFFPKAPIEQSLWGIFMCFEADLSRRRFACACAASVIIRCVQHEKGSSNIHSIESMLAPSTTTQASTTHVWTITIVALFSEFPNENEFASYSVFFSSSHFHHNTTRNGARIINFSSYTAVFHQVFLSTPCRSGARWWDLFLLYYRKIIYRVLGDSLPSHTTKLY